MTERAFMQGRRHAAIEEFCVAHHGSALRRLQPLLLVLARESWVARVVA